jgi:hypothetical protein
LSAPSICAGRHADATDDAQQRLVLLAPQRALLLAYLAPVVLYR